jgi:hypothetical protein
MAKICEHQGCGCTVDDSYCSEHCAEHGDHSTGDFGEHDCGCGHAECRPGTPI